MTVVVTRKLASGGTPCGSKHIYKNRKRACFVAAKVRREYGENVKAYKCPECGEWHIGHPIGSRSGRS